MSVPRTGLLQSRYPLLVYTLFFCVVSLHSLYCGPGKCNNFSIFATSYEHLTSNQNLYVVDAERHHDIFKYSPTFALCMFPFQWIPRPVGLMLWNLVNVLVFWAGVQGLNVSSRQKLVVLAICFFPLLGATQNAQSNGFVAGSMLLAFNSMESRQPLCSAFFICCGAFTKLFTIAISPCLVFYPQRVRFSGSLIVVTILMVLAPVPLIGMDALIGQYGNWAYQLTHDRSSVMNYSIFTLIERTTGLVSPRIPLVVAGAILLLAPLLKSARYRTPAFRAMFFSSIMIWVVIFNNKAESPTYIVAVCGAAIWCVWQPVTLRLIGFMAFYVLLTNLSLTDVVPRFIQDELMMRYALKALPSTLLWFYIQWQLLTYRVIESDQTSSGANRRGIVNEVRGTRTTRHRILYETREELKSRL